MATGAAAEPVNASDFDEQHVAIQLPVEGEADERRLDVLLTRQCCDANQSDHRIVDLTFALGISHISFIGWDARALRHFARTLSQYADRLNDQ